MAKRLHKRLQHDAGVSQDPKQSRELNDQGGQYESTPKSAFVIRESSSLVSTDSCILEGAMPRLNIADGAVRPGTAR